jgi:arylsulfatase A-like enzyme
MTSGLRKMLGVIPLVMASIAVLAFAFLSFFDVGEPDLEELWPMGAAADIEGLRNRDDLNVLFVLVDTLRADRLSSYGYERSTSPALDALFRNGIRFEHNLSQSSWTKASMASLWTSMNPTRTGVTRFDDIIPKDAVMPAEVFKDAGYRTVGLYRNGWVAPTFGFEQGFEVYSRPPNLAVPREVLRNNPAISARGTDDGLIQSAIEFIRLNPHRRWFTYVHLMDLHEYIYDEESAVFGSAYSDIYDNSVRFSTTTVDLLIQQLAGLGQLKNTIVVIGSDHGEAFRERGFEGHARYLYRETTHVPLAVLLPFRLPAGIVVKSRTRNVDIWPTVYDLVGLEIPEGLDGQSRLPEILASAQQRPFVGSNESGLSHLDRHWGQNEREPNETISLIDGSFRYVRRSDQGEIIEELFDANADPRELTDVAEQHPELLVRLRDDALRHLEDDPKWGEAETREIGEMELNQLRALGYAIE